MPYLTDDEILALAQTALPERLRGAYARVLRPSAAPSAGIPQLLGGVPEATDPDAALARELEDLLKIKLPAAPSSDDSGDVHIVEETPLGQRTTVVQIRAGALARVISQG